MTERHYNDDEVAAIFRAATEGTESGTPSGGHAGGLTLHDLHSIAREVGISPDAVSRAAQSLDDPREQRGSETFLGLPISVERTVALDRSLTDVEWELLVTELRAVFRARGTIRSQGSLREWSNGNLRAYVEPTPTGYRFRLGTFKGNARPSVAAGALAMGISAVLAGLGAAQDTLASTAPQIAVLATLGAALVANGTLRLPGWARLRRRQIDGIMERLSSMTQHERGRLPN